MDDNKQWQEDEERQWQQDEEFYSEINRRGNTNQNQNQNPANFANDPKKAKESNRKDGPR